MAYQVEYQKNISKLCLHSFLSGFRPFLPILFVFFLEHGFSYLQIGTLFSVQAITSLLLEIPAGTFADRYGAKWSLVLSSILFTFVFCLIGFVESYYVMMIIFIIWGAAKAFYSGSDTTLIIESLNVNDQVEKISKYLGKKWASFYYGLAAGGLTCPFILKFGFLYTFLATGILTFFSIFVLLTLKQPPLEKGEHAEVQHISNLKEYLRFLIKGKNFLFSHRTIKYLLLFTVMFSTSSLVFFQYIQKMLMDAGITKEYFGYFYAFFTMIAAISSQVVHILDRHIGEKRTIFCLIIITFVALISPSFLLTIPWIFLPLLLMQTQAGTFTPIMNHYLNRHIDSHHRATLNSMKSFTTGISMAIFSPLVGYISDKYSYQTALFVLGILLLLSILGPMLKISERLRRKKIILQK